LGPMVSGAKAVAQALLRNEIGRIITEAQQAHEIVRAGFHAGRLLRTYSHAGFSLGRIIDEIVLAASAAKVPCEIDRTD
jgi:hypothetical protein